MTGGLVIVGLGNPGARYDGTRHNIGFTVLDLLAEELGLIFTKQKKVEANLAQGERFDRKIILVKPLTFMNLSGNSVSRVLRFFKMRLDNLLVVYDDLDLALGSLRIRERGSAGTHNGMRSIIASLGSGDFARMRLGIGRKVLNDAKIEGDGSYNNSRIGDVRSHVLGKFSAEERKELDVVKKNVVEALLFYINNGVVATMNEFNRTVKK